LHPAIKQFLKIRGTTAEAMTQGVNALGGVRLRSIAHAAAAITTVAGWVSISAEVSTANALSKEVVSGLSDAVSAETLATQRA
jgi:hypothetical protein